MDQTQPESRAVPKQNHGELEGPELIDDVEQTFHSSSFSSAARSIRDSPPVADCEKVDKTIGKSDIMVTTGPLAFASFGRQSSAGSNEAKASTITSRMSRTLQRNSLIKDDDYGEEDVDGDDEDSNETDASSGWIEQANDGALPGAYPVIPSRADSFTLDGRFDEIRGPNQDDAIMLQPTDNEASDALTPTSAVARTSSAAASFAGPLESRTASRPATEQSSHQPKDRPEVVLPSTASDHSFMGPHIVEKYAMAFDEEAAVVVGGPIVAELAVDAEQVALQLKESMEAEMEQKVEKELEVRLERQRQMQVVAEAINVDDEQFVERQKSARRQGRRWLVFAGAFCFVIVVVGTVVGLVAGNKVAPTATPSPTQAPIIVTSDAFNSMVDRIGHVVTSDAGVFQSNLTPQFAAMDWLANNDTWVESIGVDNVDPRMLIERYVMALLYISTGGEEWRNRHNFLQPLSVCEWFDYASESADWLNLTATTDWENVTGVSCWDDTFIHEIRLHDEGLKGTLPSELALLSSLEWLYLYRNRLSGTIPPELYTMSTLSVLDMSDNPFYGTLSADIGQLTRLRVLDVSSTGLGGTVPDVIYSLTGFNSLILWGNFFTGTIGTGIGNLVNLAYVDFGRNEFTGVVPTELGRLQKVKQMYMEKNCLEGSLPSEIGLLTLLDTVWCHNNKLEGTVPTQLSNLVHLETFYMENNHLTGSLDDVFCATNASSISPSLQSLTADCSGNPPKLSCECCTECFAGEEYCRVNEF